MPALIDVALFATPFVLFFLWRWLLPGARPPPLPVIWLCLAGVVLAAAATAGYGLWHRLGRDVVYVPGELQPDGSVAPARAVPKT
ncbi:hypothetical protein [Roseomonas sp. BN140053]|uniref:hypothetical protein n=1 Tax=Roseomonas sp. BN140053 TaxID=3391898 RepID=UPI0039E7E87A